jgi:hypothetical protein
MESHGLASLLQPRLLLSGRLDIRGGSDTRDSEPLAAAANTELLGFQRHYETPPLSHDSRATMLVLYSAEVGMMCVVVALVHATRTVVVTPWMLLLPSGSMKPGLN